MIGLISLLTSGIAILLVAIYNLWIYSKIKDKTKLYMGLSFLCYAFSAVFAAFAQGATFNYVLDSLSDFSSLIGNILLIMFVREILFKKTNIFIITLVILAISATMLYFIAPIEVIKVSSDVYENSIPLVYGIPIEIIYFLIFEIVSLLFYYFGAKIKKIRKKSYLLSIAFAIFGVSISLEFSELLPSLSLYYRILHLVGIGFLYFGMK